MALRVEVSARAATQVRSAAAWWAASRPAAPGAITADFGGSVALLAEQPGIGAKYAGAPHPEAEAELGEAAIHYAEHASRAVAEAFLAQFERVRDLLVENQARGPHADYGLRVYRFDRFPYSVISKVQRGDGSSPGRPPLGQSRTNSRKPRTFSAGSPASVLGRSRFATLICGACIWSASDTTCTTASVPAKLSCWRSGTPAGALARACSAKVAPNPALQLPAAACRHSRPAMAIGHFAPAARSVTPLRAAGHVTDLWRRALERRVQRDKTTWRRAFKLAAQWLPRARIPHLWPNQRFDATHQRQEPGARIVHAGICAGGAR